MITKNMKSLTREIIVNKMNLEIDIIIDWKHFFGKDRPKNHNALRIFLNSFLRISIFSLDPRWPKKMVTKSI